MCAVSAIGDNWQQLLPNQPYAGAIAGWPLNQPTRAEFEQLKKDMLELRELLVAAKKYDDATGQPHCETEDKVALIKKLAKLVGVSMDDVFGG